MKSFQEMISYEFYLYLFVSTKAFQEAEEALAYRKYQFMEANTQRRGTGLKEKIPDIQKTLDMVQFLKTRKVRHVQRLPHLCGADPFLV